MHFAARPRRVYILLTAPIACANAAAHGRPTATSHPFSTHERRRLTIASPKRAAHVRSHSPPMHAYVQLLCGSGKGATGAMVFASKSQSGQTALRVAIFGSAHRRWQVTLLNAIVIVRRQVIVRLRIEVDHHIHLFRRRQERELRVVNLAMILRDDDEGARDWFCLVERTALEVWSRGLLAVSHALIYCNERTKFRNFAPWHAMSSSIPHSPV